MAKVATTATTGGTTQVSEGIVFLALGLLAFTFIYTLRGAGQAAKGAVIDPVLGAAKWGEEGLEYWTRELWENPTDWLFGEKGRGNGAPSLLQTYAYNKAFSGRDTSTPSTGETERPRAGIVPGTTTTPVALGYILGRQTALDFAEARQAEDRWGWGLGPVKGSWGLDW